MDSVNRGQEVSQPTHLQGLQETEKTDGISRGFDKGNSFSARTGGGYIQLPPGLSDASTIPEPDAEITGDVGDLKRQVAQQSAANMRGQVGGLFGTSPISITNALPELVTPGVGNTILGIDDKLSKLSDASPEVLDNINSSLFTLQVEFSAGELTPGKLNEILAEINSNLEDSSVKYSENKIQIASEEAQRRHDSNITHLREHIDQANESNNADPGIVFLKSLALVFPPVALWEAALEIDRDVNPGKDNSNLSIFSKSEIDYMEREPAPQNVNSAYRPAPPAPPVTSESDEATDPVQDATEGLNIAQNGMSHVEMMKLLMQMQKTEENKEKLEEAIAALESGDPSLAAEILGGSVDSLGLDSSLEEGLTVAPEKGETDFPDEGISDDLNLGDERLEVRPGQEDTTSIDSGLGEDLVLEVPDLPPEPPTPPLNDFLDRLSLVPEAAVQTQHNAIQEQGLIQRHNAV